MKKIIAIVLAVSSLFFIVLVLFFFLGGGGIICLFRICQTYIILAHKSILLRLPRESS